MIVGIVMWQLGIFNLGSTSVTASGFAKLKPQLTSCKMTTGGDFSCLFTNGAGGSINVNTTMGSPPCTAAGGNPPVGSFGAGDNFYVNLTTCKSGAVGDAYVLDVSILYDLQVAGNTIRHNDTGKVRGPYETG
ncbi:MAG: hypothetical protein PHG85_02460 [Candidatus Altiarchaeota archaeon]|nr:hypothetical protein [Candidatus Altiarchaeota archaeon]